MSTTTSEVSKKLKAAIRAKLEELGVFVDDELPDYIMVMIANKKEKKQMKDDLNLFLGKNTEKFVDWLFELFERLQSAPKAASPPPAVVKEEKKTEKEKPKEVAKEKVSSSKDKKEVPEKTERKRIEIKKSDTKEKHREKEKSTKHKTTSKDTKERKEVKEEKVRETRKRKVEEKVEKKKVKEEKPKEVKREQHERKPIRAPREERERKPSERERRKRSRSKTYSDDERQLVESDKNEVARKKLASQVVSSRPLSPPPVSVQSQVVVKRKPQKTDVKVAKATTSMFMRALNEASASAGYGGAPAVHSKNTVTTEKVAVKRSAQTIRIVADSDNEEEYANGENEEEPEKKKQKPVEPKFIITLKGGARVTQESPEKRRKVVATNDIEEEKKVIRVAPPKREVEREVESEDELRLSVSPSDKAAALKEVTGGWNGHIQLDDDEDSSDDEAAIDAILSSTRPARSFSQEYDDQEPVPPTHHLSRGNSYVAPYAVPQNAPTYIPTPLNPPHEQMKLNERCRFWPNCKLETCIYIHPSKPCAKFPSCTFGSRCIYIHPACKFDGHCRNPVCPFTHSLKQMPAAPIPKAPMVFQKPAVVVPTPAVAAVVVKKEEPAEEKKAEGTPDIPLVPAPTVPANPPTLMSLTPCRFGAGCTNPNCAFKHPKECHFGMQCANAHCTFYHKRSAPKAPHYQAATSGKYKWKAPAAPTSTPAPAVSTPAPQVVS